MCILRARGLTQFLAVVDFDEIIVVKQGTLLKLLDSTLRRKSKVGAFIVRSNYVIQKNVI